MTRSTRIVLGFLTLSTLAFAADLTGPWSGTIGGPVFVMLKQEGTALSGSGGPTLADQVLTFKGGTVDGDHVVFTVGPFQFDLTVEGNTLKGTSKSDGQTSPAFFKRVI